MAELTGKPPQDSNTGELTGTTVSGRYAIRQRLGGGPSLPGGMGEVYRADDTKLHCPVAVKRVAPQLRADPRYRQRLHKEAERAARLRGEPHIATVFDVLEQDSELFIVMEYVEGETLRQRFSRRLTIKDFLELAVQCAEALQAAHKRGVVHRDLKPENIMLTPAGQVKVLDFGVAKWLPRPQGSATTETGGSERTAGTESSSGGTPGYMAPEVLLEEDSDERADIFSLGVVFYEALTGRHPFRTGSWAATTDQVLHATPLSPRLLNPQVSAELERIVTKMLAKRPEERFATAADLAVDLRRLRPWPGPWPPSPPPRPRWYRRRAVQVAGALVLVAVVFLLWWFWPRPPVERIRVAVLPFTNETGFEQLGQHRHALMGALVYDLQGSPNIQVVGYERISEILRRAELGGEDITSLPVLRTVAQFGNAQYVVVPKMFHMGNTVWVTAEFWRARTEETLHRARVEGELSASAEDTFYAMRGELADDIQKYFKEVGPGQEYETPAESSAPQTATAARHYADGLTALARGSYAEALNAFERVTKEDSNFPLAYAWMGHIYGLLGYDERARELSEEVVARITPQTPARDMYFLQAIQAESTYDFSTAEAKYRELIRFYPDEAVWYASLGEVYRKHGQYQKAIASYRDVLLRDPNYIVAYQQLGVLYARTGDFVQAVSEGQEALDRYRAQGNREGEASALVDVGEVFRLKGNYEQAKEYGERALELFQELGNEFGVIRATLLLGNIRYHEGDLRAARSYYQRVLDAIGEIRNNRLVVQALMNTGVTYHLEGQLARALEYYERSLDQERLYGEYRDWPALRERALTLSNLGSLLIDYGPDPDQGFEHVQEALAIVQTMGDTRLEAFDQMVVGLYYMHTGQHPQAMDRLRQSLALYRTIENKQGMAQATYNLGRCYFLQNQYEQALEVLSNALTLFQELQSSFGVANARIHLGWTYRRLGDWARARTLLLEGLQAAQENGYGELLPDAYNALGELYRESGEVDRARQSFQQASALWTELNASEFSIEARCHLGLLEAERGNVEGGLSYCRESVARARQLQRVHTLARTLLNLARVHLVRNDYATALEVLGELSSSGERTPGPELRGQIYYLQGKALEGLGRTEQAKVAYQQAQETIRKLQQTLAASHRESFAARSDIQVLLP